MLGYLGLPVPSNYRPDWSRLTHIAFTGPQIESGGTVSVADLSSAVPLVAEAQRNGVQSILAVRCFSAFVLKAAVSQGADGSTLRARLLLAQNIVQALAHLRLDFTRCRQLAHGGSPPGASLSRRHVLQENC